MKNSKFQMLYEEIMYNEDDQFDAVANSTYKDFNITIYKIFDQGDIGFGFTLTKPDTETFDSIEMKPAGYSTIEFALSNAKAKIDELIDGTQYKEVGSPTCPYCKKKLGKPGMFYYNCMHCGARIKKSDVK